MPPTARRLTLAVLAILAVTTVGCARRAPGPDECHEFSVRWVEEQGFAIRRSRVRFATPPEAAILERTVECLTTPYDRELLDCVAAGGGTSRCFQAFRARRGLLDLPFQAE